MSEQPLRNWAEENNFGAAIRGELARPSERQPPAALTATDFAPETFDVVKMYLYISSILDVAYATDEKLNALSVIQQRHLKETIPETIQRYETEIDEKTEAIKSDFNKCKHNLDEYKNLNKAAHPDGDTSPEARMQDILQHLLEHEILTSLDHFHSNQFDYQKQIRSRVKRRLKVNYRVNDEELSRIVDEVTPSLAVVALSTTAQEVTNHLHERLEQAQQLERSMRELFNMVNEFAVIVASQQELIDSIEANVSSAKEYLKQGVQELEKAKKSEKKKRKCTCFLVIIAAIVLVVIVIIAFGIPAITGAF